MLADKDREISDKPPGAPGATVTVSEVSGYDDIGREDSVDSEPGRADQSTGIDTDRALRVVSQQKGKVIIHCLRHAEVKTIPNSQICHSLTWMLHRQRTMYPRVV